MERLIKFWESTVDDPRGEEDEDEDQHSGLWYRKCLSANYDSEQRGTF